MESFTGSSPSEQIIIITLMPRASQHRPLGPPALKNFFESNLNFKGLHEVNRIRARVGTARGTGGVITFGEKNPETTLTSGIGFRFLLNLYFFH